MSFEEAMKQLELAKKIIDNPDTELEKMLETYEKAAKYYAHCNNILQNAEQKLNKIADAITKESRDGN